eukprot:231263-Alexandrium_andersonii.AAC.1
MHAVPGAHSACQPVHARAHLRSRVLMPGGACGAPLVSAEQRAHARRCMWRASCLNIIIV